MISTDSIKENLSLLGIFYFFLQGTQANGELLSDSNLLKW